MMTAEVIEPFPGGQFTSERVSFVTDDIIVQRLVEIEGRLKKVLAVVKMRGSEHATDFRAYNLTSTGAYMGESLSDYRGITSGVPSLDGERRRAHAGLTGVEALLLESLVRIKSASAEQLAKQTGMSITAIQDGIARLSALGYVDEDGAEKNTYRAVARPNGA
jgi:hypothetical protein